MLIRLRLAPALAATTAGLGLLISACVHAGAQMMVVGRDR